MYSDVQTMTWAWTGAVLASGVLVLGISGVVLIPVSELFDQDRLNRLPQWLRWLFVVPSAFLMSLIAEILPRVIFSALELIVNHRLLFKPGVDSLVWQFWAPLFFVTSGVSMAPRFKFLTFIGVGGLKVAVAAMNLTTNLNFIKRGGSWDALDPTTNSPIWWNSIVCVGSIVVLAAFGVVLARQGRAEKPLPRDQAWAG